ncbi:MAG: hypothetical protein FWE62_05460 [Firmicutes bacterium]|nr:hypothetical protein [Bacillota bacterium]
MKAKKKRKARALISYILALALLTTMTPARAAGTTGEEEEKTAAPVIAAGHDTSFYAKDSQGAMAWGDGAYGKLGTGAAGNEYSPAGIPLTNLAMIAGGAGHTLAVKEDGSLWVSGSNQYGQHGDGGNADKYGFTLVNGVSGIVAAAAGYGHSLILDGDGFVYSAGRNNYGQLGDDSTVNKHTPFKLMDDCASITASARKTMVIRTDGTLWGWGYGNGSFGLGNKDNSRVPIKLMDSVSAVSACEYNAFALRPDGSLFGWGNNGNGVLGTTLTGEVLHATMVMSGLAVSDIGASARPAAASAPEASGVLGNLGQTTAVAVAAASASPTPTPTPAPAQSAATPTPVPAATPEPEPEPETPVELKELIEAKRVTVQIYGSSLSELKMSITSRDSRRPIAYKISIGTYFTCRNSGSQNMGLTSTYEDTIGPGATATVYLPVACLNYDRDIPDKDDTFLMSRYTERDPIYRLLKVIDEEKPSFYAAQAAIWRVTDNTYGGITVTSSSGGTRSGIGDAEIKEAQNLLKKAGFNY